MKDKQRERQELATENRNEKAQSERKNIFRLTPDDMPIITGGRSPR